MKKLVSLNSRRLFYAGYLVAAVMLVSSCSKDHNNTAPVHIPTAYLMAFNLVPDKTAGIIITLSGNSISNVPILFTNYTGGYLGVYPGQRQVQAYDGSSAGTPLMTSTSYTFNDSSYYSLFVIGANNNYSNVIVKDNFDSLTTTYGNAYIRYINAIPDSSNPTVTITTAGGGTTAIASPFGYVSSFIAGNPGSATITVSNGGTIQATRTITLVQNGVYTVLLAGVPSGTGNQAVQIQYVENGTLSAGNSGT